LQLHSMWDYNHNVIHNSYLPIHHSIPCSKFQQHHLLVTPIHALAFCDLINQLSNQILVLQLNFRKI
jgi:hypothetical protein